MASEKSLKHGVTEQLIAAAKRAGFKLSQTEIRYRLQCARTYSTEGQIANAVGDFGSWHDLIQARFPPYKADPGLRDRPLARVRLEFPLRNMFRKAYPPF